MNKTSIQWTEYSTNPLKARRLDNNKVGHHCVMHSRGCLHCYSSNLNHRFGTGLDYKAISTPQVEMFIDWKEVAAILKHKKPALVFPFDMTDLFGEFVSNEMIATFFGVMMACPNLTFQVLTKRAERLPEWFDWADASMKGRFKAPAIIEHAAGTARKAGQDAIADILCDRANQNVGRHRWPLPNLWLGNSIEDRANTEKRLPFLRATPAALRWLSIEPLLEDIGDIDLTGIGWCVIGGESGHGSRQFDFAWARRLLKQCREQGVPVYVKQVGSKPVGEWLHGDQPTYTLTHVMHGVLQNTSVVSRCKNGQWKLSDGKGGRMAEWPEDLRCREMPKVVAVTPAARPVGQQSLLLSDTREPNR